MPRVSPNYRPNAKLQKLLNHGQNKSFISEKNVLSQDRKLRGRILKPIEFKPTKREPKRLKQSRNTPLPIVAEHIKFEVLAPQHVPVVVTPSIKQSQKVLLYKTIQRLCFIHPFPNLIAVQIKIVLPPSPESEIGQILSAKNFIFQKNSFLKMVDSTRLDTCTHNIMFMLHGTNNEEPRTVRFSTKRPAINMELERSTNGYGMSRFDAGNDQPKPFDDGSDQPKPLDLRTIIPHELQPKTVLNRNIVNKLQRLNTVIKRLPDSTSSFKTVAIPSFSVAYGNSFSQPFYSNKNSFQSENNYKRKARLVELIEPSKCENWQDKCLYNDKFIRYVDSYQKPVIKPASSLIQHELTPVAKLNNMKTDMWMSYTSVIESFDRDVSLAELDSIPIETIYNPGEDINLCDYL